MAARNAVGRIRKAARALAELGDEDRLLKAASVLNETMLALHKKKTQKP